ncbi:hypothetical protein LIER_00884 [Lithospermum erythrorhizon]|uniref:Uncharacterized protein n=1 Tax=Lithospermum erythrorhizon TaxID=34254 RepID=A0AAV3NK19_LITER
MGWSESEIICMKHPNHKQQPGICSCCLNEKLSKVSGGPTIFSSPSNISSPTNNHYYSSGSSSSPSHSRHHHRTASDSLNSSFISRSGGGGGGLKKSRSIVITMRGGRVKDGVINGKKKKEGFWSKLIKSTSGRRTKESFVHPRMNVR